MHDVRSVMSSVSTIPIEPVNQLPDNGDRYCIIYIYIYIYTYIYKRLLAPTWPANAGRAPHKACQAAILDFCSSLHFRSKLNGEAKKGRYNIIVSFNCVSSKRC